MSNVFISYSSTDRPFVLQLAEDLQRAGHSIWLDQWKITGRHPYWDEIQSGLEYCSHFIFVISPEAIDKESGARRELYHIGSLKPIPVIIPVMARETPYSKLPMLISPGQYQIHDFVRQPYPTALSSVKVALSQDANAPVIANTPVLPSMPIQRAAQQPSPGFNYSVPASPLRKRSSLPIVLISGVVVSGLIVSLVLFVIYMLSPRPPSRPQAALAPTSSPPGVLSPTISALSASLTAAAKAPTTRFVTTTPFPTFPILQMPTITAIVIVPQTSTFLPVNTPFLLSTSTTLPPTPVSSTATGAVANSLQACPNSKFPWQFTNGGIAVTTTDLPMFSAPTTDPKTQLATIPKGTVVQINSSAVCYSTYTLWNVYFKDKNVNGWSPESELSKGYFMKPYN